nr:hypothetical protein HmN_000143500 [Hymenolepis microstoma]
MKGHEIWRHKTYVNGIAETKVQGLKLRREEMQLKKDVAELLIPNLLILTFLSSPPQYLDSQDMVSLCGSYFYGCNMWYLIETSV